MYPITKNLVTAIHDGVKNSAEEFNTDDICIDYEKAEAIYISTFYGIEEKAVLVGKIIKEVLMQLTTYPHLKGIYTKPRTEDGERLARQFAFEKLEKSDKIYFFSREDM